MMTVEQAVAEARRYEVSHGGEFVSPAIYRAAAVLADEVEELDEWLDHFISAFHSADEALDEERAAARALVAGWRKEAERLRLVHDRGGDPELVREFTSLLRCADQLEAVLRREGER